jgi:hypothetical protein
MAISDIVYSEPTTSELPLGALATADDILSDAAAISELPLGGLNPAADMTTGDEMVQELPAQTGGSGNFVGRLIVFPRPAIPFWTGTLT